MSVKLNRVEAGEPFNFLEEKKSCYRTVNRRIAGLSVLQRLPKKGSGFRVIRDQGLRFRIYGLFRLA